MDDLKWPREIWMAERDEHDQGVVSAVLSEHATVARWEGDKERDREFHHYIDADIFESAERYFKVQIEAMQARVAAARRDAFEEAAKACEKIEDDYDDDWRKGGKSDSHLEGMSDGANDCASAIRALAEKG